MTRHNKNKKEILYVLCYTFQKKFFTHFWKKSDKGFRDFSLRDDAEQVNKFSNLWPCSAVLASFVSFDFFYPKNFTSKQVLCGNKSPQSTIFLRENFPEPLWNEFCLQRLKFFRVTDILAVTTPEKFFRSFTAPESKWRPPPPKEAGASCLTSLTLCDLAEML